ncbi:MAG TPA: TIGR01777 family oxidoreductase [Rhabdochlamydiaceae bacterium]|nr:TIGR01777 family oxidoreductase [Rhabdochlamydiaceae bacterium]
MDILISGAGGFVGSALATFLQKAGHQVTKLVRNKNRRDNEIFWDPISGEVNKEDFEDFEAVIHLAGKNIAGGRWSAKRKQEIFLSRARDTWLLSQVLLRLHRPPKTFICASAIGIYGDQGAQILTEDSPAGEGFLAEVCSEWEKATVPIANRGTRVVNTRFGLILDKSGGMLSKILPIFKLGLGGVLGNGKQFVSWVALNDVIGAIDYALIHHELEGPMNVTAPNPVIMEEFIKSIAKKLHRPAFFNLPGPLLKLIFGEEMAKELFLASTRAIPQKLLKSGYSFQMPDLETALNSLL